MPGCRRAVLPPDYGKIALPGGRIGVICPREAVSAVEVNCDRITDVAG